jgi:hypothetical protein
LFVASELARSEDLIYPSVPASVLLHYTEEELRALLERAEAEAEVEAELLTLGEVTAHLRSLVK